MSISPRSPRRKSILFERLEPLVLLSAEPWLGAACIALGQQDAYLGNSAISNEASIAEFEVNAGTLARTTVDAIGRGFVDIDLEERRIRSDHVFFVDDDAPSGGTGTLNSPFENIDAAIQEINAAGYPDAMLNVAAGTYTWGAVEPRFDMSLVGVGRGQTVVQGNPSEPAARSRQYGVDLYLDSVSMFGGDSVLDVRNGSMLTLVDSEFAYSDNGDGVDVSNFDTVVVYNTWVHHNWQDGFSYHSGPAEILEYRVRANDNGQNGEWNSQGSTTHSSIDIVRVDSEYVRNPTNIGDVSTGTSWNVDISTRDAQHAFANNFYFSRGTAWFISGDHSQGGNIRVQADVTGHFTRLFDPGSHTIQLHQDGAAFVGPDDSLLLQADSPDPPLPGATPVLIGDLGRGIQMDDRATGNGFLMYSEELVHDRFIDLHSQNARHIVAVRFANGQWEYNNDAWLPFTPRSTDTLLASANFDADKVSSLQGQSGQLHGITFGYQFGDLSFQADSWNGVSNDGEFEVSGTFFVRSFTLAAVQRGLW